MASTITNRPPMRRIYRTGHWQNTSPAATTRRSTHHHIPRSNVRLQPETCCCRYSKPCFTLRRCEALRRRDAAKTPIAENGKMPMLMPPPIFHVFRCRRRPCRHVSPRHCRFRLPPSLLIFCTPAIRPPTTCRCHAACRFRRFAPFSFVFRPFFDLPIRAIIFTADIFR